MVDMFFVIAYLMFLLKFQIIAGKLPDTESLRNVTHCDISSALNIACGIDEVIAIHSVKLAYNVTCQTTCCHTYDSSDCFADFDTDITREFRRTCSGRQTCTVSSIQTTADFCAFGVRDVSYVYLQYYCIPGSRTMAICDTGKTLTSDGPPLYITSENYPDVTIGSTSCACSIEANSCSSSITVYEADIDLYLDTTNCLQNVVFKNGADSILTTIGCESYYTEYITSRAINSHYSKIVFNNTSTANQEGLFFLGLKASDDGVSFSLSCTSVPENLCVGCGALQNITNGVVELRNSDDTSYGAIADVSCNNGYETNTLTISCQENNTWPDVVCTVKDCGPASIVQFGNVTLDGTTTFGSTATVECETGYRPSDAKITCLASGQWETPECNQEGVTTPSNDTTQKKTASTDIVIIIVPLVIGVIVVLILVQISLITCFHCCQMSVNNNDNQAVIPRLGKKILVGSVPVLGFRTVYRSWKQCHRVTDASENTERTSDKSNKDLNQIPLEKNTDSLSQLNGKLPAMNSTMTHGLSTTSGDQNDDTVPVFQKQKLPPISQYLDTDHHHHHHHHHHHFSAQVEQRRHQLQPVMDEARKQGKHVELVRDHLYINNCLYQPENQHPHHEHKTVKFV